MNAYCAYCRPWTSANGWAQIERLERLWGDSPVKVSEKKCRGCKSVRHWWFYATDADLGFTATR